MLRMLSCVILLVGLAVATHGFDTDGGLDGSKPCRTLEADTYASRFELGGPYNGNIDEPLHLDKTTAPAADYLWTVDTADDSKCSFQNPAVLKPVLSCSGQFKVLAKVCLTGKNDKRPTIVRCTKVKFESSCGEDPHYPCQIATYSDLTKMRRSLHYELVNDIQVPGDEIYEPAFSVFRGSLNGNGHTISDVLHEWGLLAAAGYGAEISNLVLRNFSTAYGAIASTAFESLTITNVTVENSYVDFDECCTGVGGLIGTNKGLLRFTNCHIRGGFVKSPYLTGGFVGYSERSIIIEECSAGTDVAPHNETGNYATCGGFVGSSISGTTIENSYTTGNILGCSKGGGLVAEARYGLNISNCYALGDVSVTREYGGGLVGVGGRNSIIKNSFATGKVSTDNSKKVAGGIMGEGSKYSQLSNNYCLTAPAIGNFKAQESEARIVESSKHFKNGLHQPMAVWDPNVWKLDANGFPTLRSATTTDAVQCSVSSCENSTFLKRRTREMRRNFTSMNDLVRNLSKLKNRRQLGKSIKEARDLLVRTRPLTLENIVSARSLLDDLSNKMGKNVKVGRVFKKEQKEIELQIKGVLSVMDELEADCCDLV